MAEKKNKGNGEDKELKGKMAKDKVEEGAGGETAGDDEARKKEEEMLNQLQEEIDRLTTKDIISQMMMSLSSLAYKKMGIPAGVNDKYKDKQQARMAVDAFDGLLKVIREELGAQELENYQSSLSNLQLNFVKVFP